ncbi:MAG: hypothetical protein SGI74_02330 [Oligoflexia bacterium]|nr:hypothetical protein [Oligoflexia bacterium]
MDALDKRSETSPINGKNGGVKTAKGKAISCQNSTKHGIFEKYSTSMDDITYEQAYNLFADEFGDDTPSRSALIGQLAILHIRLCRCIRFESEFLKEKLNPPKFEQRLVKKGVKSEFGFDQTMFESTPDVYETIMIDQGEPMTLNPDALLALENVYTKYESQFLSRFCHIVEFLTRNTK